MMIKISTDKRKEENVTLLALSVPSALRVGIIMEKITESQILQYFSVIMRNQCMSKLEAVNFELKI